MLNITTQSSDTIVVDIDENSNGYIAGLRSNDKITHINDQPVNSLNELSTLVNENGIGSIVTVERARTIILCF